MKKLFRFIIWLAVVLVIIVIVKTLLFKSLQQDFNSPEPIVFGDESVSRLAGAVKFPTVSYEFDSPVDTAAFLGYMEFLKNEYPLVHSRLKREVINQLSMLYTWEGSNRSAGAMVLMAHYDVVPPGDTALWEKGPFSGYNDGTYIWGRGTLDDKVAMISILEAVEKLLSEGFVPERTVYLSFGHDEEISGVRGAATIAATLRERGVKVEYVLDEGMAVTKGMVPLIKKPVALIGTSEKGYISVKLSCGMPGGHSSTPEKESALTLIAGAVDRLNKNQMKPHFSGPVNDFIRYVGPEMPF
ncbi:MAG: M20/M25/M40 family metallo-hydrolase, partial [Bacteroidales bacterium]|nr:M20/M25/M40 family metallo-hydrolase [Bacteroidales bacterium]